MKMSAARLLSTAGVVACLTATGCSPQEPAPAPSPSATAAASPSPSSDPAVSAAQDKVLDQYRRFGVAYDRAGETANYQDEELLSFLETPLKQNVVAFLAQMDQKGTVYQGHPVSTPTLTKIDLVAKPPTAVIEDCYDGTNYHLIYKKTGAPVPIKSGPRRYILRTTARNFDGRGWLFTESQGFPERTC